MGTDANPITWGNTSVHDFSPRNKFLVSIADKNSPGKIADVSTMLHNDAQDCQCVRDVGNQQCPKDIKPFLKNIASKSQSRVLKYTHIKQKDYI
jgi:hypothetical protein